MMMAYAHQITDGDIAEVSAMAARGQRTPEIIIRAIAQKLEAQLDRNEVEIGGRP